MKDSKRKSTAKIIAKSKSIQRAGGGYARKIINDYIFDCVENIVNNFGCFLENGIHIEAVLIPITYRHKNYISKSSMYSDGERKEIINPHYPDHYLNIRASGAQMELNGMKFKASQRLKKKSSNLCYNGKEYKKVLL